MCQMRGAIRRATLLKNAKGSAVLFSYLSHVLVFKSPSCHEAVHLSTWEVFVCRVSPLVDQIVRGPITANVGVSAVAGIGGLSNGAKRNAKADQLRPVPRPNLNKENESN